MTKDNNNFAPGDYHLAQNYSLETSSSAEAGVIVPEYASQFVLKENEVPVGTNCVASIGITAASVGLAGSTALLVAAGPEPHAVNTILNITRQIHHFFFTRPLQTSD